MERPMKRKLLIVLFSIAFFLGFTKSISYHSPVNGIMLLSGTFGELRHNHFHAGIDIKSSNGRPGDPIFSIEKGYVSRIRVSASGYGNALYIDHPDGHTSVYAHLQEFNAQLDSFIRKYQKRHETFEIEIYPASKLVPIERGEIIGRMGNTGSSSGVHLHFEIRNTESESPLNPLDWDFNYKDDSKPFADRLYIYEINDGPMVRMKKDLNLRGASHDRSPYPSRIHLPAGIYGLGVKAFDPFNRWINRNGIYKAQLFQDGKEKFQFTMDSIPFHLSKYFGAHIDHEHYCAEKSLSHRLFKFDINQIPIYGNERTNGMINLSDDDSLKIEIRVTDKKGKQSSIHFELIGQTPIPTDVKRDSFSVYIPMKRDTVISGEKARIHIPEDAFFEAVYLSPLFRFSDDSLPIIDIADNCDAIHQGLDYQFILPDFPEKKRLKAFIGKLEGSKIKDYGGRWIKDSLTARISDLGQFSVYVDTVAPEINYLYGHYRKGSTLIFKIRDELLSNYRHIDLGYAVSINEKWQYASFDKRSRRLKLKLPDDFDAQTDTIQIEAWDRLGNKAKRQFPSH